MPTILLIRHGENEYVAKGRLAGRLQGVRLNARGRTQAEAVAQHLKHLPLKAVYSSPLERTMETAQPIAETHNLTVTPRAGLLEVDFGTWQDKTIKQLRRRKLWRVIQGVPSLARFPEGETFAMAQARIVTELSELASLHRPKDVIACVSHSDMIKLAVAYFIGLPLDMFQRLIIAPASITTLAFHEHGVRLLNLNYTVENPFQPHPKK